MSLFCACANGARPCKLLLVLPLPTVVVLSVLYRDKTLRTSPYLFYYLRYRLEHQLRLSCSFWANKTAVRCAMKCEQTAYRAL